MVVQNLLFKSSGSNSRNKKGILLGIPKKQKLKKPFIKAI